MQTGKQAYDSQLCHQPVLLAIGVGLVFRAEFGATGATWCIREERTACDDLWSQHDDRHGCGRETAQQLQEHLSAAEPCALRKLMQGRIGCACNDRMNPALLLGCLRGR